MLLEYMDKTKKIFVFYYYKALFATFSRDRSITRESFAYKLLPNDQTLLRAVIVGRINRVGYEKWIRRKGSEQSIVIYSKKKNNTTLEVIAIGNADALESFVKILWKGSKRSKVEDVKLQWLNKEEVEVNEEQLIVHDEDPNILAFEKIIKDNLEVLKPILQSVNHYENIDEITNTSEIYRSATSLGLDTIKEGSLNYIDFKSHSLGYQQSQSSRVSTLIRSITDHKHITKEVLKSYGLPVPEGKVFTELDQAKAYARQFQQGYVVKPLEGSYGQGITVGVYDEKGLEKAWKYAKTYHDKIILEELIRGIDIRILVIHGKAQVAMSRLPANVIGDGVKSIHELIEEKNKIRFKNPRLSKALIVIDRELKRFLLRQGLSLEDIPEEGDVIFLNMKGNIGSGADSINITPYVHKDLLSMAEEAAKIMGVTDYWGIDLLVERIDKNRNEQKCGIIEMNARANIFNVRFPMYGQPFDAAMALVEGELLNKKKGNTNISSETLKNTDHIITMQEDLWRIQRENQMGYTALRQSSFFADKSCGERILSKKILKGKGIPVPKHKRFKTLQEAKRFYKKNPDYKKLIFIYSYKSQEKIIHSTKEFEEICRIEKDSSVKFYLLEKVIPGQTIEILVQGSHIIRIKKEQESTKHHSEYERVAIKAVQAIPGMNLGMVQMISEDFSKWGSDIQYQVTFVSPYINLKKLLLLKGEKYKGIAEEVLTELFVSNDIIWMKEGEK